MKKRYSRFLCTAFVCCLAFGGCGKTNEKNTADVLQNAEDSIGDTTEAQQEERKETERKETEIKEAEIKEAEVNETVLKDGVYVVDFNTDSSMFHVSEACDGKGKLTAENGKMTLHISLASKNILNLFQGLAADAEKDGAEILNPTTDTVTYSDGTTEEVNGFDVPVPFLEEEFDLALIGKKGKWYDHKVTVSNPIKEEDNGNEAAEIDREDGEYTVDVVLEGGSGKASVSSPTILLVKDGKAYARVEWSSPNYDYMKIGDRTYVPVNTEGNSVFELPISVFDEKINVIADTVAMGTLHEIEYTLEFHADSIEKK